jgi:hypothetical protein
MTIHWKGLEGHFLMVPLVFQFNHFRVFLKKTSGQVFMCKAVCTAFIIYPTCIQIYVQTLPKSRKVSSRNSFAWKWSLRRLIIRAYSDGCFYEKYVKMHGINIAWSRMPIYRVIKISDHTKCWSGESPHCWAAVSRAPEFGPEFHDVIMQERAWRQTDDVAGRYCTTSRHRSCVIHCLLRHGFPIWILVL